MTNNSENGGGGHGNDMRAAFEGVGIEKPTDVAPANGAGDGEGSGRKTKKPGTRRGSGRGQGRSRSSDNDPGRSRRNRRDREASKSAALLGALQDQLKKANGSVGPDDFAGPAQLPSENVRSGHKGSLRASSDGTLVLEGDMAEYNYVNRDKGMAGGTFSAGGERREHDEEGYPAVTPPDGQVVISGKNSGRFVPSSVRKGWRKVDIKHSASGNADSAPIGNGEPAAEASASGKNEAPELITDVSSQATEDILVSLDTLRNAKESIHERYEDVGDESDIQAAMRNDEMWQGVNAQMNILARELERRKREGGSGPDDSSIAEREEEASGVESSEVPSAVAKEGLFTTELPTLEALLAMNSRQRRNAIGRLNAEAERLEEKAEDTEDQVVHDDMVARAEEIDGLIRELDSARLAKQPTGEDSPEQMLKDMRSAHGFLSRQLEQARDAGDQDKVAELSAKLDELDQREQGLRAQLETAVPAESGGGDTRARAQVANQVPADAGSAEEVAEPEQQRQEGEGDREFITRRELDETLRPMEARILQAIQAGPAAGQTSGSPQPASLEQAQADFDAETDRIREEQEARDDVRVGASVSGGFPVQEQSGAPQDEGSVGVPGPERSPLQLSEAVLRVRDGIANRRRELSDRAQYEYQYARIQAQTSALESELQVLRQRIAAGRYEEEGTSREADEARIAEIESTALPQARALCNDPAPLFEESRRLLLVRVAHHERELEILDGNSGETLVPPERTRQDVERDLEAQRNEIEFIEAAVRGREVNREDAEQELADLEREEQTFSLAEIHTARAAMQHDLDDVVQERRQRERNGASAEELAEYGNRERELRDGVQALGEREGALSLRDAKVELDRSKIELASIDAERRELLAGRSDALQQAQEAALAALPDDASEEQRAAAIAESRRATILQFQEQLNQIDHRRRQARGEVLRAQRAGQDTLDSDIRAVSFKEKRQAVMALKERLKDKRSAMVSLETKLSKKERRGADDLFDRFKSRQAEVEEAGRLAIEELGPGATSIEIANARAQARKEKMQELFESVAGDLSGDAREYARVRLEYDHERAEYVGARAWRQMKERQEVAMDRASEFYDRKLFTKIRRGWQKLGNTRPGGRELTAEEAAAGSAWQRIGRSLTSRRSLIGYGLLGMSAGLAAVPGVGTAFIAARRAFAGLSVGMVALDQLDAEYHRGIEKEVVVTPEQADALSIEEIDRRLAMIEAQSYFSGNRFIGSRDERGRREPNPSYQTLLKARAEKQQQVLDLQTGRRDESGNVVREPISEERLAQARAYINNQFAEADRRAETERQTANSQENRRFVYAGVAGGATALLLPQAVANMMNIAGLSEEEAVELVRSATPGSADAARILETTPVEPSAATEAAPGAGPGALDPTDPALIYGPTAGPPDAGSSAVSGGPAASDATDPSLIYGPEAGSPTSVYEHGSDLSAPTLDTYGECFTPESLEEAGVTAEEARAAAEHMIRSGYETIDPRAEHLSYITGPEYEGPAGLNSSALEGRTGTEYSGPLDASPDTLREMASENVQTVKEGGNLWNATRRFIGEDGITRAQVNAAWGNPASMVDLPDGRSVHISKMGLVEAGDQVILDTSVEPPKFQVRALDDAGFGSDEDLARAYDRAGQEKPAWLQRSIGETPTTTSAAPAGPAAPPAPPGTALPIDAGAPGATASTAARFESLSLDGGLLEVSSAPDGSAKLEYNFNQLSPAELSERARAAAQEYFPSNYREIINNDMPTLPWHIDSANPGAAVDKASALAERIALQYSLLEQAEQMAPTDEAKDLIRGQMVELINTSIYVDPVSKRALLDQDLVVKLFQFRTVSS